ncbi:hypothetical protein FO519_010511, partial [Halicephalobus sp. NKZ332]
DGTLCDDDQSTAVELQTISTVKKTTEITGIPKPINNTGIIAIGGFSLSLGLLLAGYCVYKWKCNPEMNPQVTRSISDTIYDTIPNNEIYNRGYECPTVPEIPSAPLPSRQKNKNKYNTKNLS